MTDHTHIPLVEHLLTYRKAADLLGVSDRTVWTLVNRGELAAVRVGRSVRIDPADLRQFIDEAKCQPGLEVAHGQ